jgi:hypothetical protein
LKFGHERQIKQSKPKQTFLMITIASFSFLMGNGQQR